MWSHVEEGSTVATSNWQLLEESQIYLKVWFLAGWQRSENGHPAKRIRAAQIGLD